MLGQGVLRACLLDPAVTRVVAVGRTRLGRTHSKLREVLLPHLLETERWLDDLGEADACFFCLGVSAFGMAERDYTRVTYDLTMTIARPLARDYPGMTFVYVSGAGTGVDRRAMWARVKGRTEAALTAMPFKAVYLFRPGFVQPIGVVSKTRLYRAIYALSAPVAALVGALAPSAVTTTETLGRAMIAVARRGYPARVLGNREINDAAQRR